MRYSACRNPPCAPRSPTWSPLPAARRGTTFGVFAAGFGAATFAGGLLTGALYDYSVTVLTVTVAALQPAALVLLLATARA